MDGSYMLIQSKDEGLWGKAGLQRDRDKPCDANELVCATSGCGLSDNKSRVADAHNRSTAAKKLGVAVVLCLVFIVVEVIGGLISHSLAVLTDAAHLLSDVAGFAISLFAIWASSWEATPRQSYGYFRLEILGALLSIQLIWLLTGIIVYEAIYRMIHSSAEVDGRLMFIVAAFGFIVNVIMVFLLGHHGHSHSHHGHSHSHSQHDEDEHGRGHIEGCKHDHAHESGGYGYAHNQSHCHNHDRADNHHDDHLETHHQHQIAEENNRISFNEIGRSESFKVDMDIELATRHGTEVGNINVKGAWLHVLGDLIQSIGVMVGGAIIWAKPSWKVVDLICTLFFSVVVLGATVKILRDIMEILMESTPREVDAKKLEKGLCDIPGVEAIHDLHIWAITMGKTLLACHVTIYPDADADAVLQKVIGYCDQVFNISHVTFQIERQRDATLH